jgi:mRNA interferase HigB
VHIVTKRRLKDFGTAHADARASLATWTRVASAAEWGNLVEVRASWPSADQVGNLTVFNIGGNKYRLITYIDYRFRKIFIRAILTHAAYDTEEWKHDTWY